MKSLREMTDSLAEAEADFSKYQEAIMIADKALVKAGVALGKIDKKLSKEFWKLSEPFIDEIELFEEENGIGFR